MTDGQVLREPGRGRAMLRSSAIATIGALVLPPIVGDDGIFIDGFHGDLVAGLSVRWFQNDSYARSVLWRLPSAKEP